MPELSTTAALTHLELHHSGTIRHGIGVNRLLGNWRADRLNLRVKLQRFMAHVASPTNAISDEDFCASVVKALH